MDSAEQDIWEDYLLGRLDPAEREQRKKQLSSDPKLASQVADLQGSLFALQAAFVEQEKTELAALYAETKTAVRPLWPRILPYVGAVAAAAVLIFTLWFPRQALPLDRLADRQWEPYELVSMRTGDATDSPQAAARSYYQQAQYAEALQLLEADTSLSNDLILAKGLSQYKTGQPEASARTLSLLLADPFLGEAAQWYRSLSQLKAGQLEDARNSLNRIAERPTHYKRDAAIALLEALPEQGS